MDLSSLIRKGGPKLHAVTAAAIDFENDLRALAAHHPGLTVRRVRGRKSTTAADLFDEIGAALQLPLYFGENLDALHDCLHEGMALMGESTVVWFSDAELLLKSAPSDWVARFAEVVREAVVAAPLEVVWQAAPAAGESVWARWR